MTKLKTISLLFLLSNMTLYPLTDADWRVINTLLIGSTATGAATGALLGHQIGAQIGRTSSYLGKKTTKKPQRQRQVRTAQGGYAEGTWKSPEQQNHLQATTFGTTVGAVAGSEIGRSFVGKRLATAYIARKYGVDRITAWRAIRNDLDLSERLKK